jgi:hypothetical protein
MITQLPDVVGIIAVGAEGMYEIQDEDWWRESTELEIAAFESACRDLIRSKRDDKAAMSFRLGELLVDGTGRPYWLVTVLDNAGYCQGQGTEILAHFAID